MAHRDDNVLDWSDGNQVQLKIEVRAKSYQGLKMLVSLANEYADELVNSTKTLDKCRTRALRSCGETIFARLDVAPNDQPTTPSPLPHPFDPLTFLQTIASDALERAARLESGAAKVFTAHDADEQREVADRYRLRAEAYKIAALEMKLEMEKRGSGSRP